MIAVTPESVLDFWFGAPPEGVTAERRTLWFGKSADTDALIRRRFADLHAQARSGALAHWRAEPRSCLAFVIVTDQFPRNLFRGTPDAFATDALALAAAKAALESGFDRSLAPVERVFLYLPFEHSESRADQDRAVALFDALRREPGMDGFYDYAVAHQRIVARFGRFPHRNEILGRESTPEELAFLKEPGSSF